MILKKDTAFTEAVEVSMALCAQKHNSVTTIINNQLLTHSLTLMFRLNKVFIERRRNMEQRMYVRAGKGDQSRKCLRRTHIPFIFLNHRLTAPVKWLEPRSVQILRQPVRSQAQCFSLYLSTRQEVNRY